MAAERLQQLRGEAIKRVELEKTGMIDDYGYEVPAAFRLSREEVHVRLSKSTEDTRPYWDRLLALDDPIKASRKEIKKLALRGIPQELPA